MFRTNNFRQQAQSWQQQFRQVQSAGLLQRVLAWVALGIMIMLSLGVLVVVMLVSWILVPIMLYRARKQMRKAREQYQQQGRQPHHDGNVIEGEIVSRHDD